MLRYNLEAEGYSAEVVGDGEAATERLLAKKENFDAVVLDIMLPGKDGFSVVSELRAASNYVPVLMLTARGQPEEPLDSHLGWPARSVGTKADRWKSIVHGRSAPRPVTEICLSGHAARPFRSQPEV